MLEKVAQHLELSVSQPRRFLVSVSGGRDSTVLLYVMKALSKKFPMSLEIFHMNFKLRGKNSDQDEEFVRSLAKKYKLPAHIFCQKIPKVKSIQENARRARFEFLRKFADREIVEAHHADDQVETFLFRLFRGAGLHGLSAMKMKSLRDGLTIWRPLLIFSRADIAGFARRHRVRFREDASNSGLKYDRNWLRHKIIPDIEDRFPRARQAIRRTIEEIQETQPKTLPDLENILVEDGWRWAPLRDLPKADLQNWLHHYFRSHLKLFLSRAQILDLASKIASGRAFSFNAPRDLIVRGRPKSRTISESRVVFIRMQG